jgi:hypothetical protein
MKAKLKILISLIVIAAFTLPVVSAEHTKTCGETNIVLLDPPAKIDTGINAMCYINKDTTEPQDWTGWFTSGISITIEAEPLAPNNNLRMIGIGPSDWGYDEPGGVSYWVIWEGDSDKKVEVTVSMTELMDVFEVYADSGPLDYEHHYIRYYAEDFCGFDGYYASTEVQLFKDGTPQDSKLNNIKIDTTEPVVTIKQTPTGLLKTKKDVKITVKDSVSKLTEVKILVNGNEKALDDFTSGSSDYEKSFTGLASGDNVEVTAVNGAGLKYPDDVPPNRSIINERPLLTKLFERFITHFQQILARMF